jgi:hypothetical protein
MIETEILCRFLGRYCGDYISLRINVSYDETRMSFQSSRRGFSAVASMESVSYVT